jgi:hypothetical protein
LKNKAEEKLLIEGIIEVEVICVLKRKTSIKSL